nr:uncharacterized protein LOC110553241 [Meriones unguiculatus]
MANLRPSRLPCIRAAFSAASFRKWQRHARHRLQVNSRKNLLDFAEGIWREFLDPYDDSDPPGHANCRSYRQRACRLLGDRNRITPYYTARFKTAEEASGEDWLPTKALELTTKASGWGPITLEVNDVDMQPEGDLKALGPQEASGLPAKLCPSPEDWRMTTKAASPLIPVEALELGRHLPGRARAPRSPPRLGSDRDKGPRLSLSKRKLELLLAEPERIKRKKKYVAEPGPRAGTEPGTHATLGVMSGR